MVRSSRQQSGLPLVLEPITFTVDADDGRVVKDAIEHRGGEHAIAGGRAGEAVRGIPLLPEPPVSTQTWGLLAAIQPNTFN